MAKFPKLIHVVEGGDPGETYLVAYKNGVESLDKRGTEVAIYQLVKVGTLGVQKQFLDKPRRRVR